MLGVERDLVFIDLGAQCLEGNQPFTRPIRRIYLAIIFTHVSSLIIPDQNLDVINVVSWQTCGDIDRAM
jgi:hypothetical protein